jgi:hypothetical protein
MLAVFSPLEERSKSSGIFWSLQYSFCSSDYSFSSSLVVALQVPYFGTSFLYLLAIAELLPDGQSDDVDWLNVPWFGSLFKL